MQMKSAVRLAGLPTASNNINATHFQTHGCGLVDADGRAGLGDRRPSWHVGTKCSSELVVITTGPFARLQTRSAAKQPVELCGRIRVRPTFEGDIKKKYSVKRYHVPTSPLARNFLLIEPAQHCDRLRTMHTHGRGRGPPHHAVIP